eukprot:jgi/Ulvmu1/4622/UM002_0352.1
MTHNAVNRPNSPFNLNDCMNDAFGITQGCVVTLPLGQPSSAAHQRRALCIHSHAMHSKQAFSAITLCKRCVSCHLRMQSADACRQHQNRAVKRHSCPFALMSGCLKHSSDYISVRPQL